jgi:signal transduction histidine kinase
MSSHPALVSFRILPPVWQRWWFLLLASLGAVGLAYIGYKYRLNQLLELERVRTRIATDLHDDIGSSLSRMAILSEVLKQDKAVMPAASVERLTDIAETSRGLVDTMSDIVWSIDPRRDDLRNVIFRVRQFSSDVLEAKKIKWSLEVAPELERIKLTPEQRRHLFLIFKEALTNIARHSNCSTVSLTIGVTHAHLHVEISDDGEGFVPPDSANVGEDRFGGHGLTNMRSRAAELGGELKIQSTGGSGTQVHLIVPINPKHGMNMLFSRLRH